MGGSAGLGCVWRSRAGGERGVGKGAERLDTSGRGGRSRSPASSVATPRAPVPGWVLQPFSHSLRVFYHFLSGQRLCATMLGEELAPGA